MKLVEKKEFVVVVLDSEHETFIIHIVLLNPILLTNIDVHLSCKLQIASLGAKKAFTKIFTKYADFAKIFFPDLASKLFKYTGINNYTIKLVNSQQLFYGFIYNLA